MDTIVSQQMLLEVRGCKQAYHKDASADLVVLDGVNLALREGEMVALLGRSGSGKSTLLRIVAGLLEPTAGEVLWRDRPVHGPAEGVAMVFQSFALFPWLTVQENVELGLEARGVARAERESRAEAAIDLIGSGRVRERVSEGAVGRHASARRPGACARGASRPAADGRAVQRA